MAEQVLSEADLIVHHGIANVFHQVIELPCILEVAEEIREIILGCY